MTTPLHEITPLNEGKLDVWICAGLNKSWRVTDGNLNYGEWDALTDATTFLHLLLDGNPTMQRLG